MIILLTNDDGYDSEGILILEQVLSQKGHEVWVCAPSEQQSAQSHAMSLKGKVRIHRYGDRHYHCSGTPSDCILYGLGGNAIPVIPDVIISGINHGYNASTDILYSGTVGAASEAALRGYPSIAISARMDLTTETYPFETGALFIHEHLEDFLPLCTREVLLNINIPPHPNGGWRVGHIGQLEYLDVVERTSGPKNMSFDGSYYWVFANVTASLDRNGQIVGYYSIRRKPSANSLKTIIPLYQELLAKERSGGIEASQAHMDAYLKNQGVDYDTFANLLQRS